MAIDPKLLVLKPVSELETVNNPTTGSLLFYDGGDELKKTSVSDFYDAMQSAYLGIATTTTTPPATGAYWYRVDAPGTYTNFLEGGSPIVVSAGDLTGNDVFLEVKDNVATKRVKDIPVVDTKLPLYSTIKSANIAAGTQFIDDENGNVVYRVKTGQTLNVGELPANVVGTKVDRIGIEFSRKITPYSSKVAHFNSMTFAAGSYIRLNLNDLSGSGVIFPTAKPFVMTVIIESSQTISAATFGNLTGAIFGVSPSKISTQITANKVQLVFSGTTNNTTGAATNTQNTLLGISQNITGTLNISAEASVDMVPNSRLESARYRNGGTDFNFNDSFLTGFSSDSLSPEIRDSDYNYFEGAIKAIPIHEVISEKSSLTAVFNSQTFAVNDYIAVTIGDENPTVFPNDADVVHTILIRSSQPIDTTYFSNKAFGYGRSGGTHIYKQIDNYTIQIQLSGKSIQSGTSKNSPQNPLLNILKPITGTLSINWTSTVNGLYDTRLYRAFYRVSGVNVTEAQNYFKGWYKGLVSTEVRTAEITRRDFEHNSISKQLTPFAGQIIDNLTTNEYAGKKLIATIVSDDGTIWDYTMFAPLFKSYNIPMSLAIVRDWMSNKQNLTDGVGQVRKYMNMAEIRELMSRGWSCASHNISHTVLNTNVNEADTIMELREGSRFAKNYGFSPFLIYPGGGINPTVQANVLKYYYAGFGIGAGVNRLNTDLVSLHRCSITKTSQTQLQTWTQEGIDASNSSGEVIWMIYYAHGYEAGETGHVNYDPNLMTNLEWLINHLKSNGFEFVNLNEGFSQMYGKRVLKPILQNIIN